MFARPVKLFHFIFLFRKVGSRRKRDHTGGDEGRAVTGPHLFMVSILFLVILTVVQGCQCAGGCDSCERARKAENERDGFVCWTDNRTILKDPDFQYASEHSLQQDTK